MRVTAIAAVAKNNVIGLGGDIPWSIPEDWQRFKSVTCGGALIMGRRTFEAIGDPLPKRLSIVVTRRDVPVLAQQGPVPVAGETAARFVNTLDQALAYARQLGFACFIGGGAQIYRLAWPATTDLDITHVDVEPEGDAVFPQIEPTDWQEISRIRRDGYAFVRYRRKPGGPPAQRIGGSSASPAGLAGGFSASAVQPVDATPVSATELLEGVGAEPAS